jgi:hypothetical protein
VAWYWSAENSRVTFTGTPEAMHSVIAGRPSAVPGILMNRLRRATRACSALAASMVAAVSYASSGDTASDTQPSTPSVRSWTGRKASAARRRSSIASSKKSSSSASPDRDFSRIASS